MANANMQLYIYKQSTAELPMFLSAIQAGFPSPADDYLEEVLSLDDICIAHPASTFLGRVTGRSLQDINVFEGDIAIIDKSLKPANNDLVVCAIDGEFNAKILNIDKGRGISLLSANAKYPPIEVKELSDFKVWGVITFVIQNIKARANDWDY